MQRVATNGRLEYRLSSELINSKWFPAVDNERSRCALALLRTVHSTAERLDAEVTLTLAGGVLVHYRLAV